jgi:hypothetical protein
MKTNNLLCITTAAVATAALTVAIFGGGSMEAGDDSASAGPEVAHPKLTIKGVDLSLAAAGAGVVHAGDQPTYEIKAVNTTDQPATVDVCLSMTATPPILTMSRLVRMPECIWTTNESLQLNARETKTLTVETRTGLPTNSLIAVHLSDLNANQSGQPNGIFVSNISMSDPTVRPIANVNSFVPNFQALGIVALNFSTVTIPAAGVPPGEPAQWAAAKALVK